MKVEDENSKKNSEAYADNTNTKTKTPFNRFQTIIIIILLFIICMFIIYIINDQGNDYEAVKDSTVKIISYDENGNELGHASGFCAFREDFILTNFHVIDEAKRIEIITDNMETYEVTKVEGFNEFDDLAIVSGNFKLKPISIGNSNKLKSGEEVTTIGSPKGLLNTVSTGVISNADDDYRLRITAPISPGSSGGVLLNSKKQAIGVVYATNTADDAQNINYAIRISYANNLYNAINMSSVININEGNYLNYYGKITEFIRYTYFIKSNYYSVDNLEYLYKLTNKKKKFEFLLNNQAYEWYEVYNNLTSEQKNEVIEKLDDYFDIYPNDYELDTSDISDWLVRDVFLKPHLLEDYQFAIIAVKLEDIDDKDEQLKIVKSFDLDSGLKALILCYLGDYQFDEFTDNTLQNVFKVIEDKVEDKEKAKDILELMKFKVEIKSDNSLDVTYNW